MFNDNAIFWVEVEKISPNPYQPRREFDEEKLRGLADSIRQYGVLQPLVVTRAEIFNEDGGMVTRYELIAGERRLRASRLAGVKQVPVVIRSGEESEEVKLELAIIENLQREDLNPLDRARAFAQLAKKFNHTHQRIGEKVGKSRAYITNTIRILALPEEMQTALAEGKIREAHTRPLLMLSDRPEEQRGLFHEIVHRNMNVGEAEMASRRIAHERARRHDPELRPEIREFEDALAETLGTRVFVQKRSGTDGGKVVINFSSEEDLQHLMEELRARLAGEPGNARGAGEPADADIETVGEPEKPDESDEDIYAISNFSI